jgi:hypothetical protein
MDFFMAVFFPVQRKRKKGSPEKTVNEVSNPGLAVS